MKTFLAILAFVALGLSGILLLRSRHKPAAKPVAPVATSTAPVAGALRTEDIVVTSPIAGQAVGTPISLAGQARGDWFFEAVAPVRLVDSLGKTLAEGQIHSLSDWMTTDFVPFEGSLDWSATTTATTTGYLIFQNDNPSGDPALSKSVRLEVSLSH